MLHEINRSKIAIIYNVLFYSKQWKIMTIILSFVQHLTIYYSIWNSSPWGGVCCCLLLHQNGTMSSYPPSIVVHFQDGYHLSCIIFLFSTFCLQICRKVFLLSLNNFVTKHRMVQSRYNPLEVYNKCCSIIQHEIFLYHYL